MSIILFVTGMHRSATSAFAGTAVLLGASAPKRMMPASPENPKGYFEPEDIVQANDGVLAAMLRRWNEFRPVELPRDAGRARIVDTFANLLETTFDPGDICVLKDPRVSLLTPLWAEAAAQVGSRPVFAILLRDPSGSAASIMRRDGIGAEGAVALWLRYMLDAERGCRGLPRTVIRAESLIDDPVATLRAAGDRLGIDWPVAPESQRAALADFVDPALIHGAQDVDTPLLDLAGRVHTALAELAMSPDDGTTLDTLDRLGAEFDGMCPDLHAQLVYDQLGKAVTRNWEIDACRKAVGEAQARAALVTTQCHRLEQEMTDACDSFTKSEAAASAMSAARDAAIRDLVAAQADLSRARQRPGKIWRDLTKYRALTALSKASPPLPAKMARRFGRSAAKRDPNRSLRQPVDGIVSAEITAAAPTSVTRCAMRFDGNVNRDPARRDILIVTHDASRTGAPILALNLVQELSKRYNVTTLCLRGGALIDTFRRHSVSVWQADKPTGAASFYGSILDDMREKADFAFAVVNSIESRHMLLSLHQAGIPNATLLHEFASYTKPFTAFTDAFAWADHVVFSTALTLDNAVATNFLTRTPNSYVIPQGKCIIPKKGTEKDLNEISRLENIIRPKGGDLNRFIVLGAGSVCYRKGVDLFIDVAKKIASRKFGKDVQFVWVGAGYNQETDDYSNYLFDQLRRSNLSERVVIIDETSEIEVAYQLSDVLLLSSRLDPLPNVAIDAMCAGLPVLCFDQTTGIAETLISEGLGAECVAPYLDTSDMAAKISALAASPTLRADVAERTRAYAAEAFDFATYAARIETLALSGSGNRHEDQDTIMEAGDFDINHCFGKRASRMKRAEAVGDYLDAIRTGVGPRKPEPGFHPYVFATEMGASLPQGTDPYADFLRRGRPDGPWLAPVIHGGDGGPTPPAVPDIRAALHIHAYYTDQLPDIVKRLERNHARPDLFVSVGDTSGQAAAERHLGAYGGRVARLDIVPNAGRDIGPLLSAFAEDMVRDHDVIGHVHTKQSAHVQNNAVIADWIELTLSGIVGGPKAGPMLDRILWAMQRDDRTGIVYPDDPNILGWTNNIAPARRLAARMGLESLPEHFNFPMGTMFWMRSKAFKPFVDLGLVWSNYPVEPLPIDGTMLHALERLFGVVPAAQGWRTQVTYTRGIVR